MKGKNRNIYGIIGLLAIFCIGGVFAYWTQELLVHNEFKTARYDTSIEENFIPPTNWKPGEEVNKDIWISNKSTIPVFTKVVLHQEWIRSENIYDTDGNVILPEVGGKVPLIFDSEYGKAYAAQITWGNQVVLLKSGKNSDIDLGLRLVNSIDEARGKWLLVNDMPDENGNLLLYYIGVIEENNNSPLIVDCVAMNPLINPAVVEKNTYYDKNTDQWITEIKKNGTYDYQSARYTMTVNATTVQATKNAVKATFGSTEDNQDVVNYLAKITPNIVELN